MGDVAIGASVTLQYDVTVNADAVGQIVNTAVANFNFVDQTGILRNQDTPPDSTVVTVSDANLNVQKFSNKTYVSCGDEIVYTLVVTNNGDVKIESILVVDTLPAGMSYKPHSTIKNGVEHTNENPQDGINIGNLKPGEFYTIQFTALVSCPDE